QRFYVVAIEKSGQTEATGVSRLLLAISRGPEITDLSDSQWCRYVFDARFDGGQSWADFPMLGVGAHLLVITTNQYRFRDDEFFTYPPVLTPSASGQGSRGEVRPARVLGVSQTGRTTLGYAWTTVAAVSGRSCG